MLVKIHKSYRNTIAICDKDILGKTFEEGKKSITITDTFFKGDEKTEKEVLEIMEKGAAEDYTFNIVGKKSVNLALRAGLIKEEGIVKIQDVPVALVLL